MVNQQGPDIKRLHADIKKRRSFLALLLSAGDVRR